MLEKEKPLKLLPKIHMHKAHQQSTISLEE